MVRAELGPDPGLQKAGPETGGDAHRGALVSDLGLESLEQPSEPESPAVGRGAHTGRAGEPVLGPQWESVRIGHVGEMAGPGVEGRTP